MAISTPASTKLTARPQVEEQCVERSTGVCKTRCCITIHQFRPFASKLLHEKNKLLSLSHWLIVGILCCSSLTQTNPKVSPLTLMYCKHLSFSSCYMRSSRARTTSYPSSHPGPNKPLAYTSYSVNHDTYLSLFLFTTKMVIPNT